MKNIKLLLASLLILCCYYSFANNQQKADTIYYLVDTAKAPVKDRMITVEFEDQFKCYTIECFCLKYDQKPVFYYNYEKEKGENINAVNGISFISLSKLIHLSQEGGGDLFNTNHIAYFIEPGLGNKYIKHRVMLLKPRKRQIAINTEIIK
jgi:hypothetical protein